jgi:hypothetical protein
MRKLDRLMHTPTDDELGRRAPRHLDFLSVCRGAGDDVAEEPLRCSPAHRLGHLRCLN